MNKYNIENYIYIFLFIVLPVFTGYIASRRGRNPIIWGFMSFFTCGMCLILLFFMHKKTINEIGLSNKKMDEIDKQQIQMDMDRAQMQTIEQMQNINQVNDYFRMN